MFQNVKYNVLLPFQYELTELYKLSEERNPVDKGAIQECKDQKKFDSKQWFQYCFMEKPIESNLQMSNSPLLQDEVYKMRRIELDAVARSMIGLQNKENATYLLDKSEITFNIRKIRFLFTANKIGFIHMEITAMNLDEDSVRKLGNALSKITSSQPKLSYQKKLSKDSVEQVSISLKQIVENLIGLQTYLPITLYDNRMLTPYMQITMIGSCDKEDKYMFFDSIQALSKRASENRIDESQIYYGRETYISRFVGNKTACIYGDTQTCGNDNIGFITDIQNGLTKTATENYTTVYAFLISLRLMLLQRKAEDENLKYLLNAPIYLSDEDNIREYYKKCLWENGWELSEQIKDIRENEKHFQIEQIKNQTEAHGRELIEHGKTLEKIAVGVDLVQKDVSYLVGFVNNELKDYLQEEKKNFNQQDNKDDDEAIGAFVQTTSAHIDQKLASSGDSIIDQEAKKLSDLFGEKWQFVMPSSQTSLISSSVLLNRCADIVDLNFDWSGVCICSTGALEAELKRVFFDGLLDFMIKKYGDPKKKTANEIYKNWPDILLSVNPAKAGRLDTAKHFTMGSLPYLFGESKKFPKDPSARQRQIKQSEMMQKRMKEYLATIVMDYYKNISFEAFYEKADKGDRVTYQDGCFVSKCERIRNKYRNKAAHVDVMNEQEAFACYQSIITKADTYIYNAEVAGVILELFSKIDGSKIKK